jgi:hypothetical protein
MKSLYAFVSVWPLLWFAGCGDAGNSSTSPEKENSGTTSTDTTKGVDGLELKKVTFAKSLSEKKEAIDPGNEYPPDAAIHLSAVIKGRPKTGVLTSKFYFGDQFITEASFDLADVNSGVIFSIGESTFVGFSLTHDDPFPISKRFRADLYYNDKKTGSHPFHIVPPADATTAAIHETTLARNVDENFHPIDPTDTFAPTETVYLVIRGDVGLRTWMQAEWYVNGTLNEQGTRSLTFEENATDTGLTFSLLPEGGWPAGKHEVVLTMNDEEAVRKTFTIAE